MKRAILAISIAAIVGTGMYGLAASLGVSSDTLGAGSAVVAACQSATINVGYDSTYATTGYQATTVHLQHVDETSAKCGGKSYKVTLADGSGNALGTEGSGTVTASANTNATENVTFTGVSAASVAKVNVVFAG